MAIAPADLDPAGLAFLAERHLATLTTLRPDGSPHVVPVGFAYEPGTHLVRIITVAGSRKARNLSAGGARGGRAAVSQVDGGRWLTLEGTAVVTDDPLRVADAERWYAGRYQSPRPRLDRVAIELTVERVMGRY